MSDRDFAQVTLDQVDSLVQDLDRLVKAAISAASGLTEGGRRIDDHQVHAERVAYVATEVEAAKALLEYARAAEGAGSADVLLVDQCAAFVGEVAAKLHGQLIAASRDFALPEELLGETVGADKARRLIADFTDQARLRAIGRHVAQVRGVNNSWLADEDIVMVRDSVRSFANQEVGPLAEEIHRHDQLIPDTLISAMAEMGYFGMSAPE